MTRRALCSVIATGIVCGCASSPPLRYYVLSDTPAESRTAVPADTMSVRLDRVTIPTELDRAEMLLRLDPTRVRLMEGDRWAAPLDDMIRRVLTDNLAARLPPHLVADPNEPATGEHSRSLTVDIQEFDGDPTCAVTLRATWTLKAPDSPIARGSEEIHKPSASGCAGAASLPAPMSNALAQLSDRLVAALANTGAH